MNHWTISTEIVNLLYSWIIEQYSSMIHEYNKLTNSVEIVQWFMNILNWLLCMWLTLPNAVVNMHNSQLRTINDLIFVHYLTTHTSLSPIRRGFASGFVNYKKGAHDSQPQVIKFTSCLIQLKHQLINTFTCSYTIICQKWSVIISFLLAWSIRYIYY
jgi:hypothetical protein